MSRFHEGELEVQRRAGMLAEANRLSAMLDEPDLTGGAARFLSQRTFAAFASRDGEHRLWISPLTGAPGVFEVTSPTTFVVHAVPSAGDPLVDLPAGQAAGVVVADLAARRRFRINGTVRTYSPAGIVVDVDQAYGNCPQYIQQRELMTSSSAPDEVGRGSSLNADDLRLICEADTFFIGTSHPGRGVDASHRGGPPGFVRADADSLWWPDYHGNNMFNTLGNLAVDPSAALLFVDFSSGRAVHVTGHADVDWVEANIPGDDDGTGRRVRLAIDNVVSGTVLPVRAARARRYPGNPRITGAIRPGR